MGCLRKRGFLLISFGLWIGTAGAQARLASGGGHIEVVRQNVPTPATPNQPLRENDRIRTGSGSFATLELAPGNRIVLGEKTEVELRALAPGMRFSFETGAIEVLSNSPIAVNTKDGEFTSPGGLLDMNLSYRDSKLTLTIAMGSIYTAGMTSNVTFSAVNSPESRTYVAGGRHGRTVAVSPYNFYPYNVYVLQQFKMKPGN